MISVQYQVKFLSYWHTGSGLHGGTDTQLVVIKDRNGFPFLPGKTIKGLLREGAENMHELNPCLVTEDFISEVFGFEDNVASKCFFSNAELSEFLISNIDEDQKKLLYNSIVSTAIDQESGLAKHESLRSFQVTIPLTLYGRIENFPQDIKYLEQLNFCMQWIKRLGAKRMKGFGRCIITLTTPKI